MPIQTIRGPEAWRTAAKSLSLTARRGDFSATIYNAEYKPKRHLRDSERYFCIGSCFARNIEEQLIYRGARVLSKRIVSPLQEWPGSRPNGIVNKFTTQSMLNELRWLESSPSISENLFCSTPGGWRDLHIATGVGPVTLDRAIQRRRYLLTEYFPRIREADVVIFTLGLNEAWKDLASGLYLNTPPPIASVSREPNRYVLEVTSASENVAALEESYERLKRIAPRASLIVTVSPVSLEDSFTGEDVGVANMRSKAVLRAAAAEFAAAHTDVDYFPSFEMIALAPRAGTIAADGVHITDAAVSCVIARFFEAHGLPVQAADPAFNDAEYRRANPDVEAACRRGEVESGFHHWMKFGQHERRAKAPL